MATNNNKNRDAMLVLAVYSNLYSQEFHFVSLQYMIKNSKTARGVCACFFPSQQNVMFSLKDRISPTFKQLRWLSCTTNFRCHEGQQIIMTVVCLPSEMGEMMLSSFSSPQICWAASTTIKLWLG